jgi:hypothetical protein
MAEISGDKPRKDKTRKSKKDKRPAGAYNIAI